VNYLSLFSGIGGLDLGLDRSGMTCVGQVERDEFCRRVLTKHWPEVPKHDDVLTAVEWWVARPRPAVHLVAGGFPCQPVSFAGAGLGEEDPRWGWPWFLDVVRALRPRYVLMENVAALLGRGASRVLGDLAACGYDAEWDCVPAAAVGAPHRRDRWFAVAHANGVGRLARWQDPGKAKIAESVNCRPLGDTDGLGCDPRPGLREGAAPLGRVFVAEPANAGWWAAEPDVGRVAHGVPARVDRLRGLGNAVVPQVGEHIGRLIVAADLAGVSS
jgi:DNA (cytosine-5)-methyltransferase 1